MRFLSHLPWTNKITWSSETQRTFQLRPASTTKLSRCPETISKENKITWQRTQRFEVSKCNCNIGAQIFADSTIHEIMTDVIHHVRMFLETVYPETCLPHNCQVLDYISWTR